MGTGEEPHGPMWHSFPDGGFVEVISGYAIVSSTKRRLQEITPRHSRLELCVCVWGGQPRREWELIWC